MLYLFAAQEVSFLRFSRQLRFGFTSLSRVTIYPANTNFDHFPRMFFPMRYVRIERPHCTIRPTFARVN
jgi:hypothetical protein